MSYSSLVDADGLEKRSHSHGIERKAAAIEEHVGDFVETLQKA